MRPMFASPIFRMRVISVVEGISYLVLLGVAMPLKYLAGMPGPVEVVGMAHGILFVLYALAAVNLALALRWSPLWLLGAMVASVIPFGTFVIDARLRRRQRSADGQDPGVARPV